MPEDTPETPRASADQDDLDIEEDVRDLQDSGKYTFSAHLRHHLN